MSSSGRAPDRQLLPGAVSVGRLGGVPVAVHWSVAIIMAMIAWGLAGYALPTSFPGRPGWEYAVVGIVASAVFLLGLLAHEVSHAVVARRNGVGVDNITLWMLGGVAQLRGEAATPRADLLIAGVGPLVSLLLGLGFAGLAGAVAAAGGSDLLVGVLGWLGAINVLLAVFNVLPGAPLDGGRLLRAALWAWRGDRRWAAETAARAGQVLGFAFVAFGVLQLMLGGDPSGLWLALIGWFVLGAARAEERSTQVTGALTGIRVGDVMSRDPDVAPPDVSVADFIDRYLLGHRHSTFPLVEAGRPVGLVTLSRVRAVPPDRRAHTAVRDIACPIAEVPQATPDEPLSDLLPRLNRAADGRALVLAHGELVGIVSPVDVSRALDQAPLRTAGSARSTV